MEQHNNKIRGKNPERKFLKDSPPSFFPHQDGSIQNSVDLVKQMKGYLNYDPSIGYYKPNDENLGAPEDIELLKADHMYNINWEHRCNGRPGSRP